MVLCKIKCQVLVIKIGSEEEMATQKVFIFGKHLWNIITKIICSPFLQLFKALKAVCNQSLTGTMQWFHSSITLF